MISRRLFDLDDESEEIPIQVERPVSLPEDRYVNRWKLMFKENKLNNLFDLPTEKIIIPKDIISQIKFLREHPYESGGPFIFDGNIVTSFISKKGTESELDMNIDPQLKLMFHTHPDNNDRFYSPPSEIDIGTLFNNSVESNICIPHLVFSKEGIYSIYCHSQIINISNHSDDLRDNLEYNIDFNLKEYIQELRMLLGYKKLNDGPIKIIEPKITIDKFIEVLNKMGFITKLHPYTIDDIEIEIPNRNSILIGGSRAKFKILYKN